DRVGPDSGGIVIRSPGDQARSDLLPPGLGRAGLRGLLLGAQQVLRVLALALPGSRGQDLGGGTRLHGNCLLTVGARRNPPEFPAATRALGRRRRCASGWPRSVPSCPGGPSATPAARRPRRSGPSAAW